MALISGGLDSALVAKIIRQRGIDVIGLAFITPFTQNFRDSPLLGEESLLVGGESMVCLIR